MTKGPTNKILVDPVKRSTRVQGKPRTIFALVVTRGRDRSWERDEDVLFIEMHARPEEADKTFPKPTVELAITYQDTKQLIAILQKEIDWHER